RCACMHHGSDPDRSTEYKSATRYRVQGGLASEVVFLLRWTSDGPDLKPAAGLATVKGCVATRWPTATLDARRTTGGQPS
ncbi:hypothetical protein, partial [Bradyrhizobium sp. UFLA05-112]